MKIAVIHYHLKPGGVTTVIRQHVQAARDPDAFTAAFAVASPDAPGAYDAPEAPGATTPAVEFLVITGQAPPDENFPADIVVIPELGYDQPDQPACPVCPACPDAAATADDIMDAIHAKWPGGCDLIHIHNPLLAKNRSFLKIIKALREKKQRLLLHVHDFAEDGRPRNCFADEPYPEDCHWGVINTRDRAILISAGAEPDGVHLIRNAVTPFAFREQPAVTDAGNPALYPVRAIRRKNIGEAVLMSLFFEKTDFLAITLPPNSPADMPGYNGWKTFVDTHHLPVLFEASSRHDFSGLIAAAAFMITTSITEGFGFAFLEPWTAGRALAGRKLPDLCADYEKTGLDLSHLYTRLAIPAAWLPAGVLKEKLTRAVTDACRAFGMTPEGDFIHRYTAAADQDTIDFGLLDEPLQQQVISRVISDANDRRRIISDNPGLKSAETTGDHGIIAGNNQIVRTRYTTTAMADRLLTVWRTVRDKPVSHRLDKQGILSRFFHPDNFSLLKWGQS